MKDTLNPNEWIVMEALWAKSPATLGETIDLHRQRRQLELQDIQPT